MQKLGLDGNANVAGELGLREVDKALRLNIGHVKDDEGTRKAYPPDTDFECWGWMSKKGGVVACGIRASESVRWR